MNIGYIVSLKQPGLIAWVYREMAGMENMGAKISVFPTKYFVGPHMPKKEWFTARWNLVALLISHITWILKRPITYFKVLIIAVRYKAIVEFILAIYFALQMKKKGVEKIHCHLGDRKLYVGYFSRLLTDIPLSVTIHAHELYVNPNWKLFPVALNECDHIICIADLNKKILSEKWEIQEDKLHVIRLFGFSNSKENDPISVLCVGRFERKKGHDILLDAASELIKEGLDIEIWLAGSHAPGDNGVDVLGYAKKLGIENYVVNFGELKEKLLKVLYRKCDLFCLLSRHDENGVPEGIPVVLMEAMSMGKPVVATSTGATDELVEDILINEEDTQAAVDAIRRLVRNPLLRKIMGDKNREITKASYSENNIKQLFDLLAGT